MYSSPTSHTNLMLSSPTSHTNLYMWKLKHNIKWAEVKGLIYNLHKHIHITDISLFAIACLHEDSHAYPLYDFSFAWIAGNPFCFLMQLCRQMRNLNIFLFLLFLVFLILYCVKKKRILFLIHNCFKQMEAWWHIRGWHLRIILYIFNTFLPSLLALIYTHTYFFYNTCSSSSLVKRFSFQSQDKNRIS